MFLDGFIQSKLAALLRPWLVEEPQWEVKLGFLRSFVVARNLRFDCSTFDLGVQLLLKDVEVEELSVRFDHWSAPAFNVDVRGVHVTLATKETVPDQTVKSSDTCLREKKRLLSRIDPEGSALHGNFEKIISISSSERWSRSSLLNLILTKCCLHIHGIHLKMEFAFSDEACTFLWDVVELDAQCHNLRNRSIMGDLIRSIFLPLRESSFEIAVSEIEVGISRKDDVRCTCIFSSKDLCTGIYLKDLCLVDFVLHAPEVNLAFSPSQLFLLLAVLSILTPVEPKHNRNGQQLWECARNKLHTSILSRRYLLYQVIDIALLSLRFVKAYQHFLVLVGCSVDKTSQRMVIGISRGRSFPQSAIEEWTLISEIEKELHAEAIAWARRVARSRVISEAQVAEDSYTETGSGLYLYFMKMFLMLLVAWRTLSKTFGYLLNIFFRRNFSNTISEGQLSREASTHLFSFTLNLAKISVMVSPADSINLSASHKANQGTRVSYMDPLSFCLIIKELVFLCEDNIFKQYASFSMGRLEVASAPKFRDISNAATYREDSVPIEDLHRGAVETKTIVWAEPAKISAHPGKSEADSDLYTESDAITVLKKSLGKLQRTWKQLCARFEQTDVLYRRVPFVICDIRSFWLFHRLKSPDLGLWKCSLGVGKLNVSLGCSEILSISVLTRQMLLNFSEADRLGGTVVHSHSSWPRQHIQEINHRSRSKSIKDIRTALCELLPDRPIELAAFIAGPHVHLSMGTEEHMGKECSYDLIVDVHSIDLAVWPATDDKGAESFKRDKCRVNAIPEPDSRAFVSQGNISLGYYLSFGGLNADFVDSNENQQMQILRLKPVTFKLSSLRNYLHSFGEVNVASSAILSGLFKGGVVFFCIEELSVFFQVFKGLISRATIYALRDSDFNDDKGRVANIEREIVGVKSEIAEFAEITMQDGHDAALDSVATSYVITCTLEVDPFNIIIHGSIKGYNTDSSIRSGDFRHRNSGLLNFPDNGIWLSTYNMLGEISWPEDKLELHADFSGFRAAVFKFKIQIQNMIGQLEDESGFLHCMDCLHEVSLSGSTFALLLDCLEGTLPSEITSTVENGIGSSSSTVTTNYLLMNLTLNGFFLGRSSIKNLLSDTHQPDTLLSFSVAKDFQTVCLKLQDGIICIDPTTVATFACCSKYYLQCIRNLFWFEFHHETKKRAEPSEVISNIHQTEGRAENSSNADSPFSWKDGEDLTINLSQFSIILLSANESGEVREIIGILDSCFSVRPKNRRKFSFSISLLKIHSQILKVNVESTMKKNVSQSADDSSDRLQHTEKKNPISADASCSDSISADKPTESDSVCCVVQETYGNHILKGLSAFVSAENLEIGDDNESPNSDQGWVGSGSVSGLDLTVSLSEIKMFIDCIESLSGVFTKETSRSVTERLLPSVNMQPENNAVGSFPDGAIVAIQDVHQHMYVTVQHEENKFFLGGTTHYSLAGAKALFKVRSQKQRKWSFHSSWFSLESLYAKNDEGEPLLLSCCSRSGFVDISTTNCTTDALWEAVSCKAERHDGDIFLEPYYHLSKNTFHLVNKRNGCGVAFVDGVPEFVKKPGDPFKFKIIHSSSSACGQTRPDKLPVGLNGSNLEDSESQNLYEQGVVIPRIILAVDNISLTIVDELSDSDDKFPLVKGCLDRIEVAIQILPYKARVMSTLIATLYYFDAHKVLWRELVYPCQTYIFYRRRFSSQDALTSFHRVPVLLYLAKNRMDVSFTELSLDVLLYVIGKLDLAGPFAVKTSSIMANCCKVENQSAVSLLCQFYDSQVSRVGRKQSAVFLTRPIVNQSSTGSYVSIKLETLGTFSTSSIQLPLSEPQTCGWRTRIVSLQDTRTYPGPFVIVDISKNVEEGLSVVVSPLLRVHNETKFSLELSFERPQQVEPESASLFLESGDTIDDCIAAFEAVNLSGGAKKALLSLSVGNFLFSFRPDSNGSLSNSTKSVSVGWSDKIEGGKAIRLSGIIDKLGYKVRKALYAQSSKCSFSLASCSVASGDSHLATMHFLVQSIIRDVPVMKPNNGAESRSSMVTVLQQKEIFLLPTVRVYNLLQLDVHVLLTEPDKLQQSENIGNQATITCGSTAELYANPAIMCFAITLVAFGSSCKPVKSGDWIKKLNKQKDGIQFLDIDLEFLGGKYFASLRLTRDDRGILEAVIFTKYTLKNETGFPLFCFISNQKPLSRDEIQTFGTITPPHLGSFLPPQSSRSWFMKSNKMCVTLLDEETSQVTLDLDSLSGLTEISLTKRLKFRYLFKLGVSLGPLGSTTSAPAEVVSMVPRYVVSNDSNEKIVVRQCDYEDDLEGIISINSKHKAVLLLVDTPSQRRKIGIFDKLLWKHRADNDDSSLLVQFRIDTAGFGWSGPICVSSLGRFFLKFKTSSESSVDQESISNQTDYSSWDFAAVNIVEEASSLVLHFSTLPATDLPYRIENHLSFASITYFQKDTFEPESLPPGISVYYVWDDLTRPHKLVVRINGYNILREISLDKLRPWKPLSKSWQQRELAYQFRLSRIGDEKQSNQRWPNGMDVGKIGYEIYADGPTRVLRLSYSKDNPEKGVRVTQSHMRIQLRFSGLDVQLLEPRKQDFLKEKDPSDQSVYLPIIVGRLENICLDSFLSTQQKYHQIRVRSINVDAKWSAAPFASLLQGHQLSARPEDDILFIVMVLNPSVSDVTHVKYSSILLQPVNINLDEETLLKIVPFWRKSLSQSTQSQQYYFDHFEIHPIKIIGSFLTEDSYSSYNSAQEALRTLLHSVIKIPSVKNTVVELNGVLVTHAFVTTRELLMRCAQHYSWYAMRAIYIAKGSPLLPPSFTSVFDDLASSSLDIFFDPSSSLHNVRGLTLGTFKLMNQYIKGKGFSGTTRYFGDLGKTLRTAGSNVLFTAVTEISDSVLTGAESSGFNGMVTGFHQGILKLAMEPSLLGTAFMEGGPDRKIVLDHSPGIDVMYIEGYLQAMLDATYKQEYLRVKVNDNEVVLKNLPPSTSLINEIMDRVRDFLVSKALLKGDSSTITRPLRHLRGENEWRIGPTIITLCEHLFVSFAIRMLRKQTGNVMSKIKLEKTVGDSQDKGNILWRWGIGKFVMSALLAYIDGRLCRCIPHPVARRIVSGFLLSFLDKRDTH